MAEIYGHFGQATHLDDFPLDVGSAGRLMRIAEMACCRAELRGFAPGFELTDWLEAERAFEACRAE